MSIKLNAVYDFVVPHNYQHHHRMNLGRYLKLKQRTSSLRHPSELKHSQRSAYHAELKEDGGIGR
jgi:hypothetical protein